MNCNLFLTFQDVESVVPTNIVEANEPESQEDQVLDAEPPKEDEFHPSGENFYIFE